jgi:hypothetical protein
MSPVGPESAKEGGQTDLLSKEKREPLLRAKLFVPPVRPDRVTRPRLFEKINSGLDKAQSVPSKGLPIRRITLDGTLD